MKAVRLFSFLVLLTVTIISCSNSSANAGRTNQTYLPKPGKIIIVAVRTVEEWNNNGHANCTVNYPLDELSTKIETLKAFER